MSSFPIIIRPDGRSNAQVLNAQKSGRIRHPIGSGHWYTQRIAVGDGFFVGAAALSQTVTLAVTYARRPQFPSDVLRMWTYFVLEEVFDGPAIATVTASVGDNDVDGLVTVTNVTTGASLGDKFTTGAAEYDPLPEAAFGMTVTFVSTGANLSELATGSLVVCSYFAPKVKVS